MLPISYSFTVIPKFKIIKKIFKNILLEKPKICDLCCGSGYVTEFLKSNNITYKSYVGIDIDENTIKYAKKKFKGKKKIKFYKKDISKNPPRSLSNKFDLVFFLDGIEHIKKDKNAINFANKILKKGGMLILSTPNLDGLFTKNISTYMHDTGSMANQRAGYYENRLIKLIGSKFSENKVFHCNFIISELLVFITKIGYRTFKKKYDSQADLESVSKSYIFQAYKFFIRYLKNIIYLIDQITGFMFSSHCIVVLSKK